jgi:hypothetical protein
VGIENSHAEGNTQAQTGDNEQNRTTGNRVHNNQEEANREEAMNQTADTGNLGANNQVQTDGLSQSHRPKLAETGPSTQPMGHNGGQERLQMSAQLEVSIEVQAHNNSARDISDRQLLPLQNDILEAMVADNFQVSQSSNLQPGFATNGIEEVDGDWSQNMEANRLWAKHFSSGNTASSHTTIPGNWANFFITQLLTPANFSWIKNLLQSGLTLNLECEEFGSIDFFIPPNCPDHSFNCLIDHEQSKEVPPKKRIQKRSSMALLESEVRSPRINNPNNGFRYRSIAEKKCCLPCCVKPPTLKKEAIKKLAAHFCELDESEVNDVTLQAKRKKNYPVARARITMKQDMQPTSGELRGENKDSDEHDKEE